MSAVARRDADVVGRLRTAAACTVVALAMSACAGSEPSASVASAPPPGATASAQPPGVDGPPTAWISVDGGDPVAGQLGSYTWGLAGSDAPWLRGAPITVGAGEAFRVVMDPVVGIAEWRARFVPYANDGPDGAVPLAAGVGEVAFAVPPTGEWTVELTVVFADRQGEARYAWAVRVL